LGSFQGLGGFTPGAPDAVVVLGFLEALEVGGLGFAGGGLRGEEVNGLEGFLAIYLCCCFFLQALYK
jgi:hypothetical protein